MIPKYLTPNSMFSVSTSPRLTLEFANCSKEERQAWVTNGIRSELAACEACGEDACVLKVVEAQPGEKEIIVGFAIWVWSEKVSRVLCYSYTLLWSLFVSLAH